jgi:succinate dehydrogenase / fumarate reductase flavoprotein subunit
VLPYTMGDYLASSKLPKVSPDHAESRAAVEGVHARVKQLLSIRGKRTVDDFHRSLGKILWEHCGMARTAGGLRVALQQIPELREEYWRNVIVPGVGEEFNQSLERAGRVGDFFELAELMCLDALERNESCGGHFREEYQTPDGEAQRDDANYSYVAAWQYQGRGALPALSKEPLNFEHCLPSQRSYK